MTPDPTTKHHQQDVGGLLCGMPVMVTEEFVHEALLCFRVRSASRRGFVVVVDDSLVRLSDTTGTWTAEKLVWPAWIATEPAHEHAMTCVTLPDLHDVIVCARCGMEY